MATSILLVEDEKIIARSTEKQLRALGYSIAGVASTGEEAVRKALESRPDLILMDIHLGSGIDGVEAAATIQRQIDSPVVYLTAHSDEATLQRAKLTGPHGYVLKPYEDRDLQTSIEIGLYRHGMERRLRENEQWLAATLSSIGDGVIATTVDGSVRFMNALAERLTGWRQAEALGRSVVEVFRIVEERSREPMPNPVFEALKKGAPAGLAPGALLMSRGGPEFPLDDSAAPIRDLNGQVSGAVLVFRDVTERRRLEDHLRQAQKMEAIGQLAGGIAHDFNNIMTIILGFGELLLAEGESPQYRRVSAEQICAAAKRASELTQQIMAFSRKQILLPCVFNLNTVLRDMAAMIERLIGSHIEFVSQLAADLGSIKADPSQLSQVILNLATNARDAMPNGGRLIFGTRNAELTEETTQNFPDVPPGRYVLLSATDTGTGMTPQVRDRVFEPFFTTKSLGLGTGMGLSTVYGIVKQSGGHIEIDSAVGKGTTFRIYLPLVEEPQPAATTAIVAPTARGTETILLIEDEATVRQMTRTVLERVGYTILEAADGEAALKVAASHPGKIDLLITDLVMPHLPGREAAEALQVARPGLRVIYMSGYTEDVIARQGIESAVVDFLYKPFTLDAMRNKVREVLDRKGSS